MIHMRRAGWLAALLAVLATACVPKVQQPDIRLSSVRLVSLGLRGGVMDVELEIHNPNGFVLRADGLTYDLEFEVPDGDDEWMEIAEGRIDERFRVEAGDTSSVVIPVEFNYRGLGGALRSLIDRGSFEYRVSGVVAVQTPVVRDLRYSHSGTVTPSGVQ